MSQRTLVTLFYLLETESVWRFVQESILHKIARQLIVCLGFPVRKLGGGPTYHLDNTKNFCAKILLGTFGEFHFFLNILTCWPTLYLASVIPTLPCFFCILFRIATTSESLTLAGDMAVELWTAAL